MKIAAVIGARPQFIKHFPFEKAANNKFELITIHTGQHYDQNMSKIFFSELNMSRPTYLLEHGGGNHGEQTGRMLIDIEKIIIEEKPDGIVVYGDTNSTLAGALVASKLHIPLFHIESGLRSYNKKMPEEVNRILTDHISTLLFVTSENAVLNLLKEGINNDVILVGDIMKDLSTHVIKEGKLGKPKYSFEYYYATIHRPYNTDNKERLHMILNSLNKLQKKVIISLHPRTKKLINEYKINLNNFKNLIIIEPQSFFDNFNLLNYSDGLITDSGGMQKEAYWLKKKCVTIRSETEWIETVELNGNILMFNDLSNIGIHLEQRPNFWDNSLYGDSKAAEKIIVEILKYFREQSNQ